MDKFRIFGGPLDGAEVEPDQVVNGIFNAPMDFKCWHPLPDEKPMPYWRISPVDAEATNRAFYRLVGGKLVHRDLKQSA